MLQLLFDGPEWQYEQFVDEYIPMDEEYEDDENY